MANDIRAQLIEDIRVSPTNEARLNQRPPRVSWVVELNRSAVVCARWLSLRTASRFGMSASAIVSG